MKQPKYYCGPYWLPAFIQKLLSCPFNEACKDHDLHFEEKLMTRQDADIQFLKDCLLIARGRFLLEVYACVLFLLVRIGGKFSWDKEK